MEIAFIQLKINKRNIACVQVETLKFPVMPLLINFTKLSGLH